jgi:hypothetical protein
MLGLAIVVLAGCAETGTNTETTPASTGWPVAARAIGDAFRAGQVDGVATHVQGTVTTRYTHGGCDAASEAGCVEQATVASPKELEAWLRAGLKKSIGGPFVAAGPVCSDGCCTYDAGGQRGDNVLSLEKLCVESSAGGFRLRSIEVSGP